VIAFSGRTKISQNKFELESFIDLLKAENVKRYGEIGARHGDTFHSVMQSLPAWSSGVALDLPGGLWGDPKTRRYLERAVVDLEKRGYRASCMFGDSKASSTIGMFCGRGPYDAILIDGDHTLEGVTADWMNYRSMSRLVAFHDIVGTGQAERISNRPVEVPLLWKSIKSAGYRVQEFVAPGSKMGIGVVWM
jgi:hypothetical protein